MEQTISQPGKPSVFAGMLRTLKQRVMRASRQAKLDHFYALSKDGDQVLDVGVSSEVRVKNALLNIFLKRYRYAPATYTGLAVQDMDGMDRLYPGHRFVRYPGGAFPFADGAFDWVFSNAVIEHVGDEADQVEFIRQLVRVARGGVFFTTPAKFFPVEAHTNVIGLHWFDRPFYRWCQRNAPHYTARTLRLLTRGDLVRMLDAAGVRDYSIQANRVLGLTMTYTVVIRRSARP